MTNRNASVVLIIVDAGNLHTHESNYLMQTWLRLSVWKCEIRVKHLATSDFTSFILECSQ